MFIWGTSEVINKKRECDCFMKKEISSDSCCIFFEEGSAYAGKAVLISGERDSKGFLFNRHPMYWVIVDSEGSRRLYPVEDHEKDDLVAFVIEEGIKQNYYFAPWS